MNADIHGLSGAYAVDALDAAERAAFERHLARCPECQAEVASLRASASELTHLTAVPPPASLRDAVLQQISTGRPLPPVAPTETSSSTSGDLRDDTSGDRRGADEPVETVPGAPSEPIPLRRHRRPLPWLVAAAAAAVLAVGGLVWSPWDDGAPQLSASEQVVQARDAQRYEKALDGARATIVRSPSLGKAVIIADNMPAAPEGKDYQLWLQTPDGKMVSAGLMPHESKPTVSMMLEGDAAKATGAGITMEPRGGSPAPTSDPIALFEFS